jgi:hypothetical protein
VSCREPIEPIRLIRNTAELRGTCYFEFLPGTYKGQCWNEESVFLAEEVFGLIEPIIARHEPRFDHYAFVAIRRDTWSRITTDLKGLAERCGIASSVGDLAGEVGFLFTTTEAEFARDVSANTRDLARMAGELTAWLRTELRNHECVTILGM